MELTYNSILKFMQDYFETFNQYGQDPANVHRLDDYFAPDLEFTPNVSGVVHTTRRDKFYDVLLSHPSGFEKLTPEDIVVDENKKAAAVLIKAEITDSHTGKLLVRKRYFVLYPLALDENNTIKIKKVLLFWETLPPGSLEISEVFARDRR